MKPKPLEVLKNLTVPIVMYVFLHGCPPGKMPTGTGDFRVSQGRKFNRVVQARTQGGQG
jgi:hypothetical protein